MLNAASGQPQHSAALPIAKRVAPADRQAARVLTPTLRIMPAPSTHLAGLQHQVQRPLVEGPHPALARADCGRAQGERPACPPELRTGAVGGCGSHPSAAHHTKPPPLLPHTGCPTHPLQICIIGVTTQSVGSDLTYPAAILEPVSATKQAVKDARAQANCDAVVVLAHLG